MDVVEAKSRIAEALVESIFRRAQYEVSPYRGTQAQLRFGREDYSPDFSAVLPSGNGGAKKDVLIEVKYRPSIEQLLSVEMQRGDRSLFATARRYWPELYFVLVTDRPSPQRSCFQAIPFPKLRPGEPLRTVDLGALEELELFPRNIADHEELVRRIFGLLTGV